MGESFRETLEIRRRKGLKESLVFGEKNSLRYVNMIFEALFVFLMDFGYIFLKDVCLVRLLVEYMSRSNKAPNGGLEMHPNPIFDER